MFRRSRSLIIALLLLTVPVAAATWVFSPVLIDAIKPEPAPVAKAPEQKPGAAGKIPDLSALQPRTSAPTTAQFDVARIEPNGGWSVFAGTAPLNTSVTVVADGKAIGTVKVDQNGEWTLLSDHKFTNATPVLSLSTELASASPAPQAVAEKGEPKPQAEPKRAEPAPAPKQVASATPAQPASAKPAAEPQKTAAEATEGMMRNLENLVAAARDEKKAEQTAAPAPTASAATPGPTAPSQAATTSAPPAAPAPAQMAAASRPAPPSAASSAVPPLSRPQTARQAPVPVPVQFVYREATFTEDGHRAASLLLEYVMLKKPTRISMTGHADERGSDGFNLDLSRQRLQAVAEYLRANGYDGEFTLLPKGRMEPYRGVDRSRYTRDALYQLDRRVELELDVPARGAGPVDHGGARSSTN